ncbi:MAG: hypothetical protein WCI74_05755, partial [Actinomycetes bacterium]
MNRRAVSIGVAGLLVLGVIVIIVLSVAGKGDSNQTADPNFDPGDCIGVVVAASSEKADLMSAAASSYNSSGAKVDGKCVQVKVNTKASGGAETALANGWNQASDGMPPTVWAPAASTWV